MVLPELESVQLVNIPNSDKADRKLIILFIILKI